MFQIGELAMIPFKDVKELLYKLFEERMVKVQVVTLFLVYRNNTYPLLCDCQPRAESNHVAQYSVGLTQDP